MSQTLPFVQEKKIVNLEYIHSENVYSHDNIFFSPLDKNETWSFLDRQDITSTGLAFLFMRSLLAQELNFQKIQATDMNQPIKARIAKLGLATRFNQFMETTHLLEVASQKTIPSFIPDLFFEDKAFHLQEEEKNSLTFAGGGILKEKRTNANAMVERLFSEFNLQGKVGHFFLRTKSNSYLYLLNPEIKSKTFYIQQKNTFTVDFQFYHIKTNQ
ncbi:MAG: hypothetical protein KBF99_05665 [Leptospiraceae bacterium]|nr:hypothetical protein [Leptospiraceae bacterium]MBK7055018.1 hypothetical protein [Leptospiraceae bacterium]MBK9501443.1 hypothetical protein [Leptospiraceae bacterium]MBL0265590.1 hypothetical protein [Leptospiraceae bacterium]MBP9162647.1 hypothetical protein [Leptospiraceae bacterium]